MVLRNFLEIRLIPLARLVTLHVLRQTSTFLKMKRGLSSMASKASASDSKDLEHEPKRKPVSYGAAAAGHGRPRPSGSTHPQARQSHGSHWSMKLLDTMKDPNMIVKEDDNVVIIKDAYPKAKHHFLVLPRDSISSLRALNSSHVSLLQHMLELGKSLESELTAKDSSVRFQHGYHAVPSMARLHMHIISRDFNSPCLKTKKHWNSFTTEFFLPAEDVIGRLQTHGKVEVDKARYEEILKSPLKCHVCNASCQNMPKLKDHILRH